MIKKSINSMLKNITYEHVINKKGRAKISLIKDAWNEFEYITDNDYEYLKEIYDRHIPRLNFTSTSRTLGIYNISHSAEKWRGSLPDQGKYCRNNGHNITAFEKIYARNCRTCGDETIYDTKYKMLIADDCCYKPRKHKGKSTREIFTYQCHKCKTDIILKWENNDPKLRCYVCMQDSLKEKFGDLFRDERYYRGCPICGIEMEHQSVALLEVAIKNNSHCHTCCWVVKKRK